MVIFLLLNGLLLIVLQMFLPETHYLHARPYLLPILVAYGALRLDFLRALVVAFGLGLFLDLFSSGELGVSSAGFMFLTLFVFSQSQNFRFQYLPHAILIMLVSIFLYLILDYLFFCIENSMWRWPFRVWLAMASQALGDAVLAIPLMWAFDKANGWLGKTRTLV